MKVGDTVTTEAELRTLPHRTEFLDAGGRPWGRGADHWDAETSERHLVRGLVPNLPLTIKRIPHPAESTRTHLIEEAQRIQRLYGFEQRDAILDLLMAVEERNSV